MLTMLRRTWVLLLWRQSLAQHGIGETFGVLAKYRCKQ
jgi:hypothetical protein